MHASNPSTTTTQTNQVYPYPPSLQPRSSQTALQSSPSSNFYQRNITIQPQGSSLPIDHSNHYPYRPALNQPYELNSASFLMQNQQQSQQNSRSSIWDSAFIYTPTNQGIAAENVNNPFQSTITTSSSSLQEQKIAALAKEVMELKEEKAQIETQWYQESNLLRQELDRLLQKNEALETKLANLTVNSNQNSKNRQEETMSSFEGKLKEKEDASVVFQEHYAPILKELGRTMENNQKAFQQAVFYATEFKLHETQMYLERERLAYEVQEKDEQIERLEQELKETQNANETLTHQIFG